jgi:succinyl-CoA synthetase beta subunit
MELLEYQGKQLFRKHGVPTPEGRHAASMDEAAEANLPNVHTEATMLGAAEKVVELAG